MKKVEKSDFGFFLIITCLTLLLRLLTLMEVNTGVDNMDYWYSAKALIHGYDYGVLFHRNIRWGIILPTAVIQILFSSHAWVIYLPSLFMALLMNLSIKLVAERLFNRPTAYLAILLVQFFPYTIRLGSQLFLALFSINYILLSIYFLLKYVDPQSKKEIKRKNSSLIISLLLFFLAYETKISNIYFLPVLLVLIFKKKGIKSLSIYGGILFGLYLVEHLFYLIFAGEALGRLGIIMSTHFEHNSNMALGTSNFTGTFLGIFRRFVPPYFDYYWHAVFVGGILSGILLLIRAKKKDLKVEFQVVVLQLSLIGVYTLLLTFGVKSLNPVIPFEPFIVRYFAPVLPLLMVLLARVLSLALESIPVTMRINQGAGTFTLLFFLMYGGIFIISCFLPHLPSGATLYLNNPLRPKEHILFKTMKREDQINRASKEGMLLASWIKSSDCINSNRCGINALNMINRLYLHLAGKDRTKNGQYPILFRTLSDGRVLGFIDLSRIGEDPLTMDHLSLLIAYQKPFELIQEDLP